MPGSLTNVCRTLRNAFAHSRWQYADLDASTYFDEMKWNSVKPSLAALRNAAAFNLAGHAGNKYRNYLLYAADAREWTPGSFWDQPDLRIVVAQATTLRFSLHRFLNILLRDDETNIFDHS